MHVMIRVTDSDIDILSATVSECYHCQFLSVVDSSVKMFLVQSAEVIIAIAISLLLHA